MAQVRRARFIEAHFMQLRRPRYTILSLMILVLVVGSILAIFVAYRDRQRRRALQQLVVAAAQANYLNAQLTRQVAEIAVVEYTEGILKPDLATLDGEIALAKSDLTRAQERLEWAKGRPAEGEALKSTPGENEEEARRAKLHLKNAEQTKATLAKDFKERTLKALNDEVEAAKADEAAKKAAYEKAKADAMGWF
jgi:hypothetical protein